MCMYSVTAQNSRDARQGEDLVVSPASHGCSNWLTEAGKPGIAVCVPHTAALAVQFPNQAVRGATFEQVDLPEVYGSGDFLNFLDGEKERVSLDDIPRQTKVRVLHLHAIAGITPLIPAAFAEANEEELVPVSVSGGSRRNRLTRFLGSE
jgi:hypothetical protein